MPSWPLRTQRSMPSACVAALASAEVSRANLARVRAVQACPSGVEMQT